VLDGVIAVLVTYNRPAAATETLVSLTHSLEQSGCILDLVVYDNSPTPMCDPADFASGPWRLTCRHDPSNPGVSKGFNEGSAIARSMAKKWLLLLDQDTTFPLDAFEIYGQALMENPDQQLLAPMLKAGGRLYSPCAFYGGTGFHLRSIESGMLPLNHRAVLNSGLLVRADLFQQAGGYDERVRLDFADFAFLNRCRKWCQEILVLPLKCAHGFSDLDNNDPDRALRRFAWYCEGGRCSMTSPLLTVSLGGIMLVRCLRLTLRFRSLQFLATLFTRCHEPK
jgi:GT2 family glycosyltransferase